MKYINQYLPILRKSSSLKNHEVGLEVTQDYQIHIYIDINHCWERLVIKES